MDAWNLSYVESELNRFYFHSNRVYDQKFPIHVEIGESSRLYCKVFDLGISEKPVMLFLDEYDVPLQSSYVNGYYDKAIAFFKTFYGTTFKDNQYLEKTVITGVSRVAKESIFSGANNFDVYTV